MPLKDNANFFWRKHLIVVCIVLIYGLTAWRSRGYYHADEHYQIIEFAGYILGTHTPSNLAWEFGAEMRSSFQPIVVFAITKSMQCFGVVDPYSVSTVLRLISSFLFLVLGFFLLKAIRRKYEDVSILQGMVLVFGWWFLPFLASRMSAESWSGMCFLCAMVLHFRDQKVGWIGFSIGAMMGLAFIIRFQLAFGILGYLIWMVIARVSLSFFLRWTIGLAIIVVVGICMDSMFYGHIVITAWNYFDQNILHLKAISFGTEPWYYYLQKLATMPGLVFGVPFLIILLFNFKLWRNDAVWWVVFVFVACHSAIAHKEDRFLFPMAFLWPLLCLQIVNWTQKLHLSVFRQRRFRRGLFHLIIGINIFGMLCMGCKAAGIGRMDLTYYIHSNFQHEKLVLVHTRYANPYEPWRGLPAIFYKEERLIAIEVDNFEMAYQGALNYVDSNRVLIAVRRADLRNFYFRDKKLVSVIQSLPKWLELINQEYGGFDNDQIVELYEVKL